jgi:hypothetical protein
MTSRTGSSLRPKLGPLPRRVAPLQDETTESYVGRLAVANHLAPHDLAKYLKSEPAGSARRRSGISLSALAIMSGIPSFHLAQALPEIRSQFSGRDSLHIQGRPVTGEPSRRRSPCRHCMMAKNISGASLVTVWARQDQNVCLRHRLWIGQGVRILAEQLDVSDLPEITHAQIRHQKLIRRYGHLPAARFYTDAQEIIDWSSGNPNYSTARWKRLNYLFDREHIQQLPHSYDYAAYYPEVVGVLRVLVSRYWQQMAISGNPAEQERFYRQVADNGLTNGTPELNTPLRRWIHGRRRDLLSDEPRHRRDPRRWYATTSERVERPEP